MKFLNTSDKSGKILGTVMVYYTGGEMKLTIPDTDNNLTIENLLIGAHGAAELAGGGFGSITIGEGCGKTLADLLAPGYCYYAGGDYEKRTSGTATVGEGLTTLTNVYIAPCNHSGTAVVFTDHGSYQEWACPCGERTFQARVTTEGATTYYDTIAEAFAAAADGSKVDILDFDPDKNTTSGSISVPQKDLTVEIVGVGPTVSGFRFSISGSVRFIIAGWTSSQGEHQSCILLPSHHGSGGRRTDRARIL